MGWNSSGQRERSRKQGSGIEEGGVEWSEIDIGMVGETLNLGISTPDLKVIGPRHNHF